MPTMWSFAGSVCSIPASNKGPWSKVLAQQLRHCLGHTLLSSQCLGLSQLWSGFQFPLSIPPLLPFKPALWYDNLAMPWCPPWNKDSLTQGVTNQCASFVCKGDLRCLPIWNEALTTSHRARMAEVSSENHQVTAWSQQPCIQTLVFYTRQTLT